MFVITYKKFFIALSATLVALSIVAVIVFGLPLGVDFKGGSQLQVRYPDGRPEIAEVKQVLATTSAMDATVQPSGEYDVVLKSHFLSEEEKATVIAALEQKGSVVEQSFTTIGPSVGTELKRKAIIAVILVLIAIICFVAYIFRKASQPVSSWKYGLSVIITLTHDIIICIGAFAVIGHFYGAEVDPLFIVALLTTLALSISDTIVVFDRVRENLALTKGKDVPFSHVVGSSLAQTFMRSINTSFMVFVMVLSLAIIGPASTRLFSTMLAIGMFFGTYSSIFLASPLLVLMEGKKKSTERN